MICALPRAPAGPVGRAGTPDDFSYSSDIVQDTKNRLRQLESEAEVRHSSYTCLSPPLELTLDHSIDRNSVM